MKKTFNNIKEGNMPTTVQMKLLHWLTQLELSGGTADDSAVLARLSLAGSLSANYNQTKKLKI